MGVPWKSQTLATHTRSMESRPVCCDGSTMGLPCGDDSPGGTPWDSHSFVVLAHVSPIGLSWSSHGLQCFNGTPARLHMGLACDQCWPLGSHAWVSHEFIVLAHGMRMGLPWNPQARVSITRCIVLARGPPMGLSLGNSATMELLCVSHGATHGYPMGLLWASNVTPIRPWCYHGTL